MWYSRKMETKKYKLIFDESMSSTLEKQRKGSNASVSKGIKQAKLKRKRRKDYYLTE